MTIGEQVRNRRLSYGISVSELAFRSKVSKSYISNIERGIQKNPTNSVLVKLANSLHVPVNYLLDEEYDESLDREALEKWLRDNKTWSKNAGYEEQGEAYESLLDMIEEGIFDKGLNR